MNKKLLLYGLAFGSASAAISFIYLSTAAFKQPVVLQLILILSESILIPAIGIYLFYKSMKVTHLEQFTIGRAIFLGFFLSIIMSSAVSLVFSYVLQFQPELIANLLSFKTVLIEKRAIQSAWKPEELAGALESLNYSNSSRGQFVNQLFLGASRGLFLSSIIAYVMKAKVVRN